MAQQDFYQHQSQQMGASPAMQMAGRILLASGVELQSLIQSLVAANPVVDMEAPDVLVSVYDHDSEYASGTTNLEHYYNSVEVHETLHEHLHHQAAQENIDEPTQRALSLLIDSLNARGFFDEDPLSLMGEYGVKEDVYHQALHILQEMTPSGVGACDLQESLLIQLKHVQLEHSVAYRLVRDCWKELTKRRYAQSAKLLGITEEDVTEAVKIIAQLRPNPGENFSSVQDNFYVTPDVIVKEDEGVFSVSLNNQYVPRLRLNDDYKATMANNYDNKELLSYLKTAFQEGRMLIQSLEKRQQTILDVSRVIVEKQKDYFQHGARHLLPLKMATVAEELGVHVSTVSRAVAGKYLSCKWEMRELRSFFDGGEIQEGEALQLSSHAIGLLIKDLVVREDASKPLNDTQIAEMLRAKGVNIARRTVAKYREQMKILPASMRKE